MLNSGSNNRLASLVHGCPMRIVVVAAHDEGWCRHSGKAGCRNVKRFAVSTSGRSRSVPAQVGERCGLEPTVWRLGFAAATRRDKRRACVGVGTQGFEHFGRVDVLVNNAGYSLIATTEEATNEQIADLFDANYTGVVRVLRAALLTRKCPHCQSGYRREYIYLECSSDAV